MSEQNHKQALQNPIFKILSDASIELGVESYVIGGFVRDYLLQKGIPKDIDVVAVGSGIALARKVASKLPGEPKISVFKNFGTAMIKYKDMELEFVGARKESYHRDSRKPVVEDGSLQEDQERRDFTINALALSLNKGNFGDLLDPFDGIGDLEKKMIRTPLEPGITYSDDPLRMMRAIRFATQLDFTIALRSLQAITEHKDRIKIVSEERIVDELHKILACPKPSIGLSLLHKTGLLPYI
ncbi:MAG: CCA tRNA nucleotidyltransferase, partial [Maribacter sp.]|nr:CCA tRNA nucleotidyltransferase [Maribacter sp.]